MVSEEMSDGFTSPPPFSEGFWLSCSSLAARALTCPFVSQLAAGTLARVTFQHYIAQNAFYLAALSEVYERAGACIEDFEAKKLLQELREAVVQELGRYDGYAKAWDIDLKDHPEPSQAIKKYIDFLFQATSGAHNVQCLHFFRKGQTAGDSTDPSDVDSPTQERISSEFEDKPGGQKVNGFHGPLEKAERGMETELGSNKETTTSDLVDQASSDIGKLGAARAVAALLPCMQLYAFLGKELSRRKDLENHPYKEWIQSHASDAFQAASAKMERVFERVCQEDDCVQSVEALLPIYEEAMLLELNFFAEQPGL